MIDIIISIAPDWVTKIQQHCYQIDGIQLSDTKKEYAATRDKVWVIKRMEWIWSEIVVCIHQYVIVECCLWITLIGQFVKLIPVLGADMVIG